MAAYVETVDLGDKSVEVRELTIRQIRQMFRDAKGDISKMSVKDLLEGAGTEGFAKHFLPFTSLSAEEIEDLAPSEVKVIFAKIKELNADFFEMLGGLQGVLGLLANQLESLTASAPCSSSADIPTSGTTDGGSS